MATMDSIPSQLARTPDQLGNALRRVRTLKELSQVQLGALTGLRQGTISQIESGHGATRLDTIIRLLASLDLELLIAPRSRGSSQDIEDIF